MILAVDGGGPTTSSGSARAPADPEKPATSGVGAASPMAADRIATTSRSVIDDTGGVYASTASGKLPHNATIVENGYTFTTDGEGRVVGARGTLSVNANAGAARDAQTRAAQREVGWADRLPDDHGGHLIADRFNGPGDFKNLFAQNGNFNLGEYKKLENGWAKALGEGKSVDVNVELTYPQGSLRASQVAVKTRIGSGPIIRNVFDNAPGGKAQPGASDPVKTAEPAAAEPAAVRAASADAADASRLSKLATGAEVLGKVAVPVAVAADGYSLYRAYQADGDRIGSRTLSQAGSVAGGWAGAAVGAEAGAEAGGAVGAMFGGVGAVPGAIIGGAAGAVVGGIAGSDAGKAVVHTGEKVVDWGKSAAHSVASFLGL